MASPLLALPEKTGDFDDDNLATILDVVRLINHVTQADPLPSDLVPYGDVNNDGFVDQDDVQELVDRVLERLPLESLPLTFLRDASPSPGEGGVAVTRETILRFSVQLAEDHGLDSDSLFAEFGGERLNTRIHVSPDRKSVTLFYDDPLPENSRIRVTLVGDEVQDYQGRKIDGDGDGVEGGDLIFDFDTLGLTVLEGTAVCGRVFASELVQAAEAQADVNRPLEGALITADGMENEIFAITDEFGNFRLEPAPVGRFFVHIDGRTVTIDVPEGAYYPFVGKAWESIPGEEINIGDVYLPLVTEGTLQEVSNDDDTMITFPDSVLEEFPEFVGLSIMVPAGSLYSDNGVRGGQVGVAPVDPARLPGQLPEGLNPALVVTIQTDGATNFDEPAPICLPNLPHPETGEFLGPGEESALWSFNHDTGRFEIVGSMTVSEDGSTVCSDPGVGILAPGWHAPTPPSSTAKGGDLQTNNKGAETQQEPANSAGTQATAKPKDNQSCENPNATTLPASNKKTDPVHFFSGEFVYSETDLQIKGRGMDFMWTRNYRSQTGPDTAQGNGWDFSYNLELIPDGDDVVVCDGNSRRDRFTSSDENVWTRDEYFSQLQMNPDGSYVMEFENKGKWIYNAFDAAEGSGKIQAIEDRNGNRLTFFYDPEDRLIRVNDTLDRDITIAYNTDGFIASVTDFIGRTVTYDYYDGVEAGGSAGDLKSCTRPAVTGTPNGNDFPNGKTTSYTYSTGFSDERLNHNILSITDGRRNHPTDPTFGEGPFVVNTYAATQDPNDFNFDRVARQVWGGDVIDLVYEKIAPFGKSAAVTKSIINDRNGNIDEYYYDDRNRLVLVREYTGRGNPTLPTDSLTNRPAGKLRSGDPDFFETRHTWNQDSLITETQHPNGNLTQFIYESDLNPRAPRRSQGNLRIKRRLPGTHLPAGDQEVIEEYFEYDEDFGCGSCGFNFITRHVDGRGNETRMTYDDRGNLIQRIHRISSIVEDFEYNEFGQMTARVLPDNGSNHRRRDEMSYYDTGTQRGYLKDRVIDFGNLALTTTLNYDAVGNVTSIIDPRGHDAQVDYNQLDQVVRTTSREVSEGPSIRYQRDYFYDSNNNLTRLDVQNIDENGALGLNTLFTTSWNFEILNNPVRETVEVDTTKNIVTEFEYDANRNLTLVLNGEATNGNQPGNSISNVWDERDLLFTETYAPGTVDQSTTQHDYDNNGNSVTFRRGIEEAPRTTFFTYDGFDRRVRSVDAMENLTHFTYDSNSNGVRALFLGELIDETGVTENIRLRETVMDYDQLDRVVRTDAAFFDTVSGAPIDDGFATTTIDYTDLSEIATITDDNEHSKNFIYDSVGRVESVIDAKGNSQLINYDANSNILSIVDIEKNDLAKVDESFTSAYAYDNLNRRISASDNVGNTIEIKYDSRNNPTRVVDGLGNVIQTTFDGLNRKLSVLRFLTNNGLGSGNPAGQIETQTLWDDSHRVIQRIDSNGNITNTAFDSLDRPISNTYADSTETILSYDVHHNVISAQDGNGSVFTNDYDLLNRLTTRTIVPGPNVSSNTTFEVYAYDGLSRRIQAEDDDSQVTLAYDSLSNLTLETLNGNATVASFDGVGNLILCTYPGGRRIEYTYDSLDRKSTITDTTTTNAPVDVARFHFVGPNRYSRREYGNGTHTDFTYDGITGTTNPQNDFGVRDIIGITHQRTADSSTIANHTFTWDRMGNKTSRNDINGGIIQIFDYDSAYRMIKSVDDGVETGYSFDGAQNRTVLTGGENPGSYSFDATTPEPADAQVNQYTNTPQGNRVHDKNGNVVSDAPGRTMVYDYANRMVRFEAQGTIASYRYDALGRRFSKTVNDDTTQYFYTDSASVCEEQDESSETVATYVYGGYLDDVVQMQREGNDYFYHSDDLQSIIALTDSSGNFVESTFYKDYGEPSAGSTVGNPFLFTGRRYDEESGFYYYRTRYLDPIAGQFTSRDAIGIWADYINSGNAHAYAGNNPMSRVDPLGTASKLSKKQCDTIQKILDFEKKYTTGLAASKFSNTPAPGGDFSSWWGRVFHGADMTPTKIGAAFDDQSIPSAIGPIDADWFTEVLSFTGNLPEIGGQVLYHATYIGGKLVWNASRTYADGKIVWTTPYIGDPKEGNMMWGLTKGYDTFNEIWPKDWMKKNCPTSKLTSSCQKSGSLPSPGKMAREIEEDWFNLPNLKEITRNIAFSQ